MENITKDLKSLTSFLYDVVSGKEVLTLSDEELADLDNKGSAILEDQGIDIMMAKVSKFINLNILDKKNSFKIFEKLPKIWYYLQSSAEIYVGQQGE